MVFNHIAKSPSTVYLVPLRPKYPPQHHILELPQPMILPQCERPSSIYYILPENLRHLF